MTAPPDERGGPPQGSRPTSTPPSESVGASIARPADTTDLLDQLARRRDAALRCPPLGDGRRDVLEHLPSAASGGATLTALAVTTPYGLTEHETRREVDRLTEFGWLGWELAARFSGAVPA